MDIPKRKSNRLKKFDYGQQGCYFLTLCARDRLPLFGSISSGTDSTPPETDLSDFGKIICNQLQNMISTYHDIQIEKYVIMPNHVHVLFMPTDEWSLSETVMSWKRFAARKINERMGKGGALWQKESFDTLVRSPRHFATIVRYIKRNDLARAWVAFE